MKLILSLPNFNIQSTRKKYGNTSPIYKYGNILTKFKNVHVK